MTNIEGRNGWFALSWPVFTAKTFTVALAIVCFLAIGAASASAQRVIVTPKFGGQIIGYSVDPSGTEGLLAESVALENGKGLVAVEAFDQATGKILKVIAKKNNTLDSYAVQEIDGGGFGLVFFQKAVKGGFQNEFQVLDPLDGNKFTGTWTPPIMANYDLMGESVTQGTPEVAAYQSSFVTGLTYVFSSNILTNTFGPQIPLASIIDVDEFFLPAIALDTQTNEAVLASSQGCPEPSRFCAESIALVNLTTGKITEFGNDLGVGQVNGLAVDPATGIACSTTESDGGVEFYNLAKQTGFEVIIPNFGNPLDAGLDVEFDSVHQLFLTAQYSSNGAAQNPDPQVFVYDESGNLTETVTGLQRIPIGGILALNPNTRTGFLPVVVEPQDLVLQLQSFTY